MSPYLLVPIFALIAVLQATLVPMLPTGEAKPDLMLLVVVAWGIVQGGDEAVIWGLAGGLFLDLLSGVPFGVQTLALGAIGLLADLLETNFFRSNILLPLAAIFVATLLYHMLIGATLQTLGYPISWEPFLLGVVLPTAGLNTVLMPIVYGILRRVEHEAHPRLSW
jgi:rod shape-determining protein MreD